MEWFDRWFLLIVLDSFPKFLRYSILVESKFWKKNLTLLQNKFLTSQILLFWCIGSLVFNKIVLNAFLVWKIVLILKCLPTVLKIFDNPWIEHFVPFLLLVCWSHRVTIPSLIFLDFWYLKWIVGVIGTFLNWDISDSSSATVICRILKCKTWSPIIITCWFKRSINGAHVWRLSPHWWTIESLF